MDRARAVPLIVILLLVAGPLIGTSSDARASSAYRIRHYELRSLPWMQLSFSGWHRLGIPPEPPIDEAGMPLVREGGVLVDAVGELSMNGMYRLADHAARCDAAQLVQVLRQAQRLRLSAIVDRDAWWIPHEFDYPPYGQRRPWFDAMTQGLALSFFTRLHALTGDETHLEAARMLFNSFLRQGPDRPWVAIVDAGGYLWLEHYPSARPDHVLNAHLHAVFGLYEWWNATRSDEARQVLEGAITTIHDNLWRYRRNGRVSNYGLVKRSRHSKYHRIHVWQVRLLGAITGEPYFTRTADLLEADLPGPETWRGTPGQPPLPPQLACPWGVLEGHSTAPLD